MHSNENVLNVIRLHFKLVRPILKIVLVISYMLRIPCKALYIQADSTRKYYNSF